MDNRPSSWRDGSIPIFFPKRSINSILFDPIHLAWWSFGSSEHNFVTSNSGCSAYTREDEHRTWKRWFGRWFSCSRGLFSGSMLIFKFGGWPSILSSCLKNQLLPRKKKADFILWSKLRCVSFVRTSAFPCKKPTAKWVFLAGGTGGIGLVHKFLHELRLGPPMFASQ